ncbi:lactoylglutathione lyase [Streptococcus loxodontisalivarius]|uniref:Aldoketomutase n=1 Tax=Streptococcus loxodontisalivarius TaxID=1349415 RepID=A0ABS2PS45_9STRE|nr:VOC family protein [Streptococcus loxodontisalivarius]MBM7642334.1 lactoylglutathione lyase [Streptococcus loxodontisalivarius]
MKFLHTCVRVQNLEKSIQFYQEALGFKEVRRSDFPEAKFTLVYLAFEEDPSYELELTYNYDHEAYDLGNGYAHIAVGVEDLEASHQAHEEAGYTVTKLMGLPGRAPMYYFITDPDGYKIEVIRLKQFLGEE